MNWLITKLKEILFFTIIMFIFMVIYTSLILFEIVPNNNYIIRTITFIMGLILFFILGLISGKKEKKNGWLSGILSSLIIIAFNFILILFTKTNITLSLLVKYLCYILTAMTGGMIGVNLQKKRG